MKTLKEIKTAIKLELKNLRNEPYYITKMFEAKEKEILESLKDNYGYNWEEDYEAHDYFLKATPIEIYEYYIEVIMPKLELKLKK